MILENSIDCMEWIKTSWRDFRLLIFFLNIEENIIETQIW